MVQTKIDTLQLLLEPQAAKAGLRPAYFFETFTATPTTKSLQPYYTVNKDTSPTSCNNFYMIDITKDLDNYIEYGYVNGSKIQNPEKFNPLKMTLTAAKLN
jgi:hypothetical protein